MSNFELILEVAQELYGEGLVDQKDSSILILYPEITIQRPGDSFTWNIKDLVVSLEFDMEDDRIATIKGGRLSWTVKEQKLNWRHSHLPVRAIEELLPFCIGDSSLKDYIMQEDWDRDEIEYFLLDLENFLSIESDTGTAFMRIEHLKSTSNYRTTTEDNTLYFTALRQVLQLIIDNRKEFLETSWNGFKFNVELTLEGRKIDHYERIDGLNPHELLPNGETRKVGSQANIVKETPLTFSFKNRNTLITIDYDRYENEVEQEQFYISNKIKTQLEDKLTDQLNQALLRKTIEAREAEWNDKVNTPGDCNAADKTTVF